jgi:hypothetical protein
MIIWWSKHVGVILSVLVCDIWINVLLQTGALLGPLYIISNNSLVRQREPTGHRTRVFFDWSLAISKRIREFSLITGGFHEDINLGSGSAVMLLQEICLKPKCGAVGLSKAFKWTSRSKEWFCGCSLAGIAGSNLARVMIICMWWMLCVFK